MCKVHDLYVRNKKLVYNHEAYQNVLRHNNHQQKGDMSLMLPVTLNLLEIV